MGHSGFNLVSFSVHSKAFLSLVYSFIVESMASFICSLWNGLLGGQVLVMIFCLLTHDRY